MISSGTPQTKPRLTLCKTEIHPHHLHASFFSFSITVPRFFFLQGRATIWRDLQSLHPFLKSNPRHSWTEETRMGLKALYCD